VNAAVRPDRDHYFGRIWRVQHKEAKPAPVPDLSKASASNLVAALEHPSKAVRFTAHRLLWENPTPEVIGMLKRPPQTKDAAPWLHRLWLLADARALPDFILNFAVGDERPEIRKNAMRIAALRTNAPNSQLKQAILKSWTTRMRACSWKPSSRSLVAGG